MKKPTLRFRQVFEHPTHFKVTKPLGNPLIIAKKGLSPSLQGRLRKFAQGGEVRGYDNGGNVTDPVKDLDLESSLEMNAGSGDDAPVAETAPIAPTPAPPVAEVAPSVAPAVVVPTAATAPVVAPAATPVAVVAPATPPVVVAAPAPAVAAAPSPEAKTEPVKEEEGSDQAKLFQEELAKLGMTEQQFLALPPVQKASAANVVRMSILAQAQAKADLSAAEAEVQKTKDDAQQGAAELSRLTKRAEEARTKQSDILKDYDYITNPETYVSKPDTLDRIGTAIALALGGFASGLSRTPNVVLQMINNATEADLAKQKEKENSAYRRLVDAGHTADAAEELVRAQMKLVTAAEFNRKAAETKLPQVRAKIELESAKLVGDAIRSYAQVAKDERAGVIMEKEAPLKRKVLEGKVEEAEERKQGAPYRLRSLAAKAIADELRPDQIRQAMRNDAARLKLDREKAENAREDRIRAEEDKAEQNKIARELEVGDATLELKTDKRAPQIRTDISNREQGLMSAMKLHSLLKRGGLEIFNPTSDLRGEAIAELNLLMETFPKTQAFNRAISVNAKQVLEKAFQDPTGYAAFFKEIFMGRDPAVGIGAMLQEGKRSYADAVRNQVRDSKDPKIEAAIQSSYQKMQREIEKYEKDTASNSDLFEPENE